MHLTGVSISISSSGIAMAVVLGLAVPPAEGADMRSITVDSMVRVVFTGDSQTTGRNLAIDYPQLLSRILPVRVINTAVGGSNSDALVKPMTGGSARLAQGDRILYGTDVHWGMGPFPGMKVTVGDQTYTIDYLAEHPPTLNTELYLVEPARGDYQGTSVSVEPGWEVRVARHRPDVVCLMFINDGALPAARLNNWREMLRRIRAMGAVPVLMSPFPVDEGARGGSHPAFNEKVLQNAAGVRDLAAAEKAWFIDVSALTLALDPPLRSQVGDGIHPDTDGQLAAIQGLLWVFGQMGLTQARPCLKGWVLNRPPAPLADLLAGGARPFHTSQPDHPDPDHQSEKGFSLDAIRRNDELGLIASADGHCLAIGHGILLRFGLEPDGAPRRLRLRLAGTGLLPPQVWDAAAAGWTVLQSSSDPVGLTADLPLAALREQTLHVLVTGAVAAGLDAVALDVDDAATPPAWRLSAAEPRPYLLESDHSRPDNLVGNADFAADPAGAADAWRLTGKASTNRPFRAPVAALSFDRDQDLRSATVTCDLPLRPYDLLLVRGSQAGNDGAYRVRADLGAGRFGLRRRATASEKGLSAELVHDDGCGLVPGGACLELGPAGRAETTVRLPPEATALDLSLFSRVYAPNALGPRDLPAQQSRVTLAFRARDGAEIGTAWTLEPSADSFQWQKLKGRVSLPPGAAEALLTLAAAGPDIVQYTGVYVAAGPGR
jgi:hypothetical protein